MALHRRKAREPSLPHPAAAAGLPAIPAKVTLETTRTMAILKGSSRCSGRAANITRRATAVKPSSSISSTVSTLLETRRITYDVAMTREVSTVERDRAASFDMMRPEHEILQASAP
jgi:hypothetical protein